ncbi:MAG: histone deacetylase [Chloroflexota bacterium]|nr:histone deacetylase [Chloroflexota bacterium]
MTTAYITHPRYVEHDMAQHPEHAGRIRAVWRAIEESGVAPLLHAIEAPFASDDAIRALHSDDYLKTLARLETFDSTVRLDPDTYATPTSYTIARLSAGGVVRAVDAILSGEAANALAVVRPPGHHALANRAMGFCLLGNIAIAARHAQRAHGLERVMIVDYDVHHGNGTEAMFYDDPSVLFISSHQYNLFPHSGAVGDTGSGSGVGTTINIPLPGGCGDAVYRAIFDAIVVPAAARFKPEIILVSVGHDAHWTDPLALMRLTLQGYADLAQQLIDLATTLCGGRIAFVMEGGYNLDALAYGMTNVARLLVGQPVSDPLGAPPDRAAEPDMGALIASVRAVHGL